MKKTAVLLILLFFTCFATPVRASAEYESEAEISRQLDSILQDYDINYTYSDIGGLSAGDIISEVKEKLVSRVKAPSKVLGTMLIVVIFTAVMKNSGEGVFSKSSTSGLYGMVCVMTAVAVISPQLFSVYKSSLDAVDKCGGFITAFVPVFTVITASMGGITTAGVYNLMILGVSELIVRLSECYLLPLLSVTAVFAVTGSVFPSISLNTVNEFIKKAVIWAVTVTMTLFTGFVTMKCTLGGKADTVATKTVRTIISGTVPIVGGAVSDAYSTVLSGLNVIHGTAGFAGTVGIMVIMLPPLIEITVFRIVLWAGTASAEIFSADQLSKLMKGIDCGLAVAQCVLVCYSVIFILCTGILMYCIK